MHLLLCSGARANGLGKAKASHASASVAAISFPVLLREFCHVYAVPDGYPAEKHLNSSEGKLCPVSAILVALP